MSHTFYTFYIDLYFNLKILFKETFTINIYLSTLIDFITSIALIVRKYILSKDQESDVNFFGLIYGHTHTHLLFMFPMHIYQYIKGT